MPIVPILDPNLADDYGLVAIGGDLRPERLLHAYRQGVFPWYDEDGPILWWSPDPRAIFELDRFHVCAGSSGRFCPSTSPQPSIVTSPA